MAAASLAANPFTSNQMERRDRNCIYPTTSRDGKETGVCRAMCKEDWS